MTEYIIAYDLGTGGNKAALYTSNGECVAEKFIAYDTHYPKAGWHEQSPEDWWLAVINSTKTLVQTSNINPFDIIACGISGHSLGVVPIDHEGQLIREHVPIWSDARSTAQAKEFFNLVDEVNWYELTGNGFPAPLYSVFKIMWYRENEPNMFRNISKVIGTKDYINLKLTGIIATDFSYASGSGVYELNKWAYSEELIKASGLPANIFPEILPSTEVLGTLTDSAANALGLPKSLKVVTGGVDNSCMALGARCFRDGQLYNSQGSSSWIAVASSKPLIDKSVRPYVFTHVVPRLFMSAIGVFATGSSFRWIRDQLCKDLIAQASAHGVEVYDLMVEQAAKVSPGSNGLLFNPSLAGGSSLDNSMNIRGAFLGLDLGHTREDIIRATMEGIALEMGKGLDELRNLCSLLDEMVVVGGGGRSSLWRQIHADIYQTKIIKTNIDQQAAALGAAAIAAVGVELWQDFNKIDEIHKIESITEPISENVEIYKKLLPISKKASEFLSVLGDEVKGLTD